MNINNLPVCDPRAVFAHARVSVGKGDKELRKLAAEGRINVEETPTGRKRISPPDAQTLLEALVGK